MDRREHWDDDLIYAVASRIGVHYDDSRVYQVIAAVEDWQKQKLRKDGSQCNLHSGPVCECCYDIYGVNAKLQAVRDLHWERVETHTVSHYMTDAYSTTTKHVCNHCNESYPCATIKLLDGK